MDKNYFEDLGKSIAEQGVKLGFDVARDRVGLDKPPPVAPVYNVVSQSSADYDEKEEKTLPAWVLPAAIVGGALVLLLILAMAFSSGGRSRAR